MAILIGVVFYALTVAIFYFGVYRPRMRQHEHDDEIAARANSDDQTPVIDRAFVADVMSQRGGDGKFIDPRTKHVALVLANWNPGDIENSDNETYKRLGIQVLSLLNQEKDAEHFARELAALLQKRFAHVPADVNGMAIYLTNWYNSHGLRSG